MQGETHTPTRTHTQREARRRGEHMAQSITFRNWGRRKFWCRDKFKCNRVALAGCMTRPAVIQCHTHTDTYACESEGSHRTLAHLRGQPPACAHAPKTASASLSALFCHLPSICNFNELQLAAAVSVVVAAVVAVLLTVCAAQRVSSTCATFSPAGAAVVVAIFFSTFSLLLFNICFFALPPGLKRKWISFGISSSVLCISQDSIRGIPSKLSLFSPFPIASRNLSLSLSFSFCHSLSLYVVHVKQFPAEARKTFAGT